MGGRSTDESLLLSCTLVRAVSSVCRLMLVCFFLSLLLQVLLAVEGAVVMCGIGGKRGSGLVLRNSWGLLFLPLSLGGSGLLGPPLCGCAVCADERWCLCQPRCITIICQ